MDGLAARAIFPVRALARVVVPEDVVGPNWRFRPFGVRVIFSASRSTTASRENAGKIWILGFSELGFRA